MTNAEEKKRAIEILVDKLSRTLKDKELLSNCLSKFEGKSTTLALFHGMFVYCLAVFIICGRDRKAMKAYLDNLPPHYFDHFYQAIYPCFGIESKFIKTEKEYK